MKSSIKYSLLSLLGSSLLPVFADDPTEATEADASKIVAYTTPVSTSKYFQETFDDGLPDYFKHTSGSKQDEHNDKYSGIFKTVALTNNALIGDLGLVAKEKAKHYGIAAPLKTNFYFDQEEALVVSYEVNFQTGIDCGGAYIKLFAEDKDLDLASFHDKTRFSIMFGPDKCANDFKLHLILNHLNPITGEFQEKHLKEMPTSTILKPYYTDAKSHVYKLTLKKDATFKISIDGKSVSSGSLLKDMKPEINPPKEIEDPNASKPEDWDEQEKIPDPDATKPDDWNEDAPKKVIDEKAAMPSDWREDLEATIDDPDSVMPEDWDEDMDGEYEPPAIDNPACEGLSGCGLWEAPVIDNPAYKGKWRPDMIKNPNYQGKWKPDMIENPGYFEDNNPFLTTSPVAALAVEIWTMNDDIYFDNFMISEDEIEVDSFISKTHGLKVKQAKANEPSLLEKAKAAAEDNSKIMIGSVLGLGVITILIYFAFFKKSKDSGKKVEFSDTNEEKVISASQSEQENEGGQDEKDENNSDENVMASGDSNKKADFVESDTNASQTNLLGSNENLELDEGDDDEEEEDTNDDEDDGDDDEDESSSEGQQGGAGDQASASASGSASEDSESDDEPVVQRGPRKRNVRRAD